MNVQNLRPICCYGVTAIDVASAKETLKLIVKYLGTGFHPDTPAKDYICVVSKTPTFIYSEAEFYDKNLELIHELLDDVYAEAIELWHEFGMIDNEQYETLTGGTIVDYKEKCDQLEKLVNEFISYKIDQDITGCFSASVTRDCLNDHVGVRFMEEDGSPRVMPLLQEMADWMFKETGRHFCISNNSPTDGHALIFVDETMDVVFDIHHHTDTFIEQFDQWKMDPSFMSDVLSKLILFQTLDDALDRQCDGTTSWKEMLDPCEEVWVQVMFWNRHGFIN